MIAEIGCRTNDPRGKNYAVSHPPRRHGA
jgi:hypothetical protein